VIINQPRSHIEYYSDKSFRSGYSYYYFFDMNIKPKFKNKYLNYVNFIGFNYCYKVYHTKYWIEKDV